MIQVFLNGIVSGLNIALLAMAFSLVYVPTRVFHIAIGGVFAVVPYVVLQGQRLSLPAIWSIIAGLVVAVILSLGCEWLNHARLERKGAPSAVHLVASLGIYIVLVQMIAIIWGSETQVLRLGVDKVLKFSASVVFTRTQLIGALTSLALLAGFYLWLRKTNLGLQFRALADNPIELALRGYNTDRLRLLAFGMSGLLCGVSASSVAFDVGFDPHVGLQNALLAAVAVIVGGRSSFVGPVLGGLVLGILRSQVVWFMSARWQDAVTFLLLAAFLLFRPYGILGQETRVEAEA
jgi:branched-chain amino acid transport system permease protein